MIVMSCNGHCVIVFRWPSRTGADSHGLLQMIAALQSRRSLSVNAAEKLRVCVLTREPVLLGKWWLQQVD